MNEVVIDDSQREMCAVLVMRTMLTDYCNDTGVSFNDVFFRFVTSPAYKMLFDYSTGLWMEGPDRGETSRWIKKSVLCLCNVTT